MMSLLEEGCLKSANRLIKVCKLPFKRIRSIKDINSNLITSLFESITLQNLPDLLCPVSSEDEAHNVQAVIDTLSLDLLNIPLSHITGEAVVGGDIIAITNLFEIFDGILSYVISEKEASLIKKKLGTPPSESEKLSTDSKCFIKYVSADKKSMKPKIKVSNEDETLNKLDIPKAKKLECKSKNRQREHRHNNKGEISHLPKLSDSSKPKPTSVKAVANKTIKKKTSVTETLPPKYKNHIRSASKGVRRKRSVNISLEAESSPTENFSFQVEHLRLADKGTAEDAASVISSEHFAGSTSRQDKIPCKSKQVEHLYEENFESKLRSILSSSPYSTSYRNRAAEMKKMHLQYLKKPPHKLSFPTCQKSYLLPHYLRRRSISRTSPKRLRFLGSSPKRKVQTAFKVSSHNDLLQELKEEFPGLKLPSSVSNHMRRKYEDHLMTMHHQLKSCLTKKPQSQIQAEKVAKRQTSISNLLKKEINERGFLKEINDQKLHQNKIKYHVRDARLQSARIKKYCEEFREEMHRKMQKRNFSEELIVENTFKEVLNMQKAQVQLLCDQVKETGEKDAQQHLVYLNALENLYQNQFSMLAESLAAEKNDAQEKNKAQKKVVNEMRREIQKSLQKEIRAMQSNILEIMQDTHFRELDADQYKNRTRERFTTEPK